MAANYIKDFYVGECELSIGVGVDSIALPLYFRYFNYGSEKALAVSFLCFGACFTWPASTASEVQRG